MERSKDFYKFTDDEYERFLNGEEIWRDVVGWNGDYSISTYGRIISRKYGRDEFLTPFKNQNGYIQIYLYKCNKAHRYKFHRLIADAFIKNPENKKTVNHINGIKTDNNLLNLEYATHSENVLHAFNIGIRHSISRFGKNHPNSKPIMQFYKNGDFIKEFECAAVAHRETGINFSRISSCARGKTKSASGYIWKFSKNVNM